MGWQSALPSLPSHFEQAWVLLQIEQEGVTVKGSPHFNPDPDAETLYKAMKGIGEWTSSAFPQERLPTLLKTAALMALQRGCQGTAWESGTDSRHPEKHTGPLPQPWSTCTPTPQGRRRGRVVAPPWAGRGGHLLCMPMRPWVGNFTELGLRLLTEWPQELWTRLSL